MKTPVRISASKLILKKTIMPTVLDAPSPKVLLPSPSIPVAPLTQASVGLSGKAVSPTKSSVPWDVILIGVTALVVVGVIYYQIEEKRREADERSY